MRESEAMPVNPILEMTEDRDDPVPLVELKQHLIVYVNGPPGPKSARKIYDFYLSYCGDRFKVYKATLPGSFLEEWTPDARQHFEQKLLPDLRVKAEWGYGFSDGKPRDSWLFMFHGFRPFQEPEMASFYRFEFDWQVSPAFLRGFAERLVQELSILSGYGGFFLQGRPGSEYDVASYDRIFALAMRYWGCEVVDVELTAEQMKKGYKCVNWLTIIGESFRSGFRTEMEKAKSVAYDYVESGFGTLLQATETPLLGDHNRLERMDGYVEVAKALLPLQITEHQSFGGNRWTDENTMAWIRRFTHPHEIA